MTGHRCSLVAAGYDRRIERDPGQEREAQRRGKLVTASLSEQGVLGAVVAGEE